MSDYNECCRTKKIEFGNNFKTRAEINQLFGLPPGAGTMQGGASLSRQGMTAIIWWPNDPRPNSEYGWINRKTKLGDALDAQGYNEVLEISEGNSDPAIAEKHVKETLSNPESQKRYVFWHESRKGVKWYKFYGVYELQKDRTAQDGKTCWFERVGTRVDLAIYI